MFACGKGSSHHRGFVFDNRMTTAMSHIHTDRHQVHAGLGLNPKSMTTGGYWLELSGFEW
jgi:hypothetical protein